MNLLLHTSHSSDNPVKPVGQSIHLDPMETLEDMFDWLAVLWQRGLCHDNPQGKQYFRSYIVVANWVVKSDQSTNQLLESYEQLLC